MQHDLFPLRGRLGTAMTPPPQLTGLFVLDSALTGRLDAFRDALRHLALPAKLRYDHVAALGLDGRIVDELASNGGCPGSRGENLHAVARAPSK